MTRVAVVSRRQSSSWRRIAPRDWNHDGGVGRLTRLRRRAALTIRLCLMPRRHFFQTAAIKADRPTSRKIRAMPAWISPAVRVPGARRGGLGQAGQARRVGEGQHLRDRISDRQYGDPAHQHLTRLLPCILQAKAVLEVPEQRLHRPSLGISADHQRCGQRRVGADQQSLLAWFVAPVGTLQFHPHRPHHPPAQEPRGNQAGAIARDFQLAVEDLGAAVLRNAATRSGVSRAPYRSGRPWRRLRGGFGTSNRARSRRTQPITVWPAARARWISQARMDQASTAGARGQAGGRADAAAGRRCAACRGWCRGGPGAAAAASRRRRSRCARSRRQAQPALTAQEFGRFGLALWSWCVNEPGASVDTRSTTLSSIRRTRPPGGTASSALRAGRPRPEPGPASLLEERVVRAPPRARPLARMASVTWPLLVAAPQQQVEEGGAPPCRHGRGNARDDAGQDGEGGMGHWLNLRDEGR